MKNSIKTVFELYLDTIASFDEDLSEDSIDRIDGLLTSLTGHHSLSSGEKSERDVNLGDLFIFITEKAVIEYVIVDIYENDLFLAMKVSEWIEFANEQDFLFDDNGIGKMIQTGSIYLVSQDTVKRSLFQATVSQEDLHIIIECLKQQQPLPAKRCGKILPIEDRYFQHRFHTLEVDSSLEHLHHDNYNFPIPVPLSLQGVNLSNGIITGAAVGFAAVSFLFFPFALLPKLIIPAAIGMKMLNSLSIGSKNVLSHKIGANSNKGLLAVKLKKLLTSVSGLIFPFFTSASTYKMLAEASFKEKFRVTRMKNGDIALIINKEHIGKHATLYINEQPLYEGTLKPLYSFGTLHKNILPTLKKDISIELKNTG